MQSPASPRLRVRMDFLQSCSPALLPPFLEPDLSLLRVTLVVVAIAAVALSFFAREARMRYDPDHVPWILLRAKGAANAGQGAKAGQGA